MNFKPDKQIHTLIIICDPKSKKIKNPTSKHFPILFMTSSYLERKANGLLKL